MAFVLAITSHFLSDTQQPDTVVVDDLLREHVDIDTTVRAIRNTITEHQPVDVVMTSPNSAFVSGGELRTYVVVLLISSREQGWRPTIAWTHTELRMLQSGGDFIGYDRPNVFDVVQRGESILMLHVAKSVTTLTVVEPGPEAKSEWKVSRSTTLDLPRLLGADQERVGFTGRIVQLDDKDYLHFSRADSPDILVYRVDNDGVPIETDAAVLRAVVDEVDKTAGEAATSATSAPAETDHEP